MLGGLPKYGKSSASTSTKEWAPWMSSQMALRVWAGGKKKFNAGEEREESERSEDLRALETEKVN